MIEKFTSYYITLVFTPQLMCCEQAFDYTNYFFSMFSRVVQRKRLYDYPITFVFFFCWWGLRSADFNDINVNQNS